MIFFVIMNKHLMEYFQKVDQLSTKKETYRMILDELFTFFVRNDRVENDSTVQAFLSDEMANSQRKGVISAKSPCIVAGVEEACYLAEKHTGLRSVSLVRDGTNVVPGAQIISFLGSAKDILAYERVFVNMVQRMSGIATETAQYVEAVKESVSENSPLIAATRKTPWMHVDKKAVAIGGGVTHRLNLQDGILLKDNHLELVRQQVGLKDEAEAIVYVISHAKIFDGTIAVEIEVKTDDAAIAAVAAWSKRGLGNVFILLLDNFTPQRAEKILQEIRKNDSAIFFEASGGITLENVADFASAGVDVISVGSLTHSPKAVDLSMDIY